MDINYIDSGYFDQGYFIYTADAAAAVASTASLSCSVTLITPSAQAELTSTASLTALASKIKEAVIILESYLIEDYIQGDYFERGVESTLICAAGKVKEVAATVTSAVSTSIAAVKVANGASTAAAQSTMSSVAGRIQQGTAAFTAAFSPTMTVSAVKNMTAVIDSQATISIVAIVNRSAAITLSTIVSLNAQAMRLRGITTAMTSTASQSTTARRTRSASATLTSTATLTASVQDLDLATAALSAAFALTANANKNVGTTAALTSAVTVTAAVKSIVAQKFFANVLSDNTNTLIGRVTAVDDENNVYAVGAEHVGTSRYLLIVKYTGEGVLLWQKHILLNTASRALEYFTAKFYDDYLYIAVSYYDVTASRWKPRFIQLNRDGSIISSYEHGQGSSFPRDFIIDSTGVYVTGQYLDDCYIEKWSSWGTQVWGREYTNTTREHFEPRLIKTSSHLLSFSFDQDQSLIRVIKTDLDGTYVFSKSISFSNGLTRPDVKLGSDGYIYMAAGYYGASVFEGTMFAKLDANLNVSWARTLTSWGNADLKSNIILDSGNSVYSSVRRRAIKIDSSGTLEWTRNNDFIGDTDPGIDDTWLQSTGTNIESGSTINDLVITQFSTTGSDTGINVSSQGFTTDGNFVWDIGSSISLSTVNTANITISDVAVTRTSATETLEGFSLTISNTSYTHTVIIRLVSAATVITSAATMSVSAVMTKGSPAALTAVATMSVTARKTARITKTLSAVATTTAAVGRIQQGSAALASSASLTATAIKATVTAATLNSVAALSVTAKRFRGISAAISSQASLTANYVRTRDFSTAFSAIATELTAAAKIGQGLIGMDVIVTADISAVKTSAVASAISSSTTLSITYDKFRSGTAALSSSATVAAAIFRNRPAAATLTSTASLTANVVKLILTSAAMSSQATMSVTAKRLRGIKEVLNSQATLNVTATKAIVANAALNSNFTAIFVITALLKAQAELSVQGFILTAGRVIHIDTDNQLVVKDETRIKTVTNESRYFIVSSETRSKMVIYELRTLIVDSETRKLIL